MGGNDCIPLLEYATPIVPKVVMDSLFFGILYLYPSLLHDPVPPVPPLPPKVVQGYKRGKVVLQYRNTKSANVKKQTAKG